MPPPALVEESETLQSQESEVVQSQEAEMETEAETKTAPVETAVEKVLDEKEKAGEEEEEHRKMPEHPGRDSDSEDSETEEDTEKSALLC